MEISVHCPDDIHLPRVGKTDRKKKLSINTDKNVAKCWVCGYATRRADLLIERYGLDVLIDRSVVLEAQDATPKLHLPAEFSTDFNTYMGRRAFQYLRNRDISTITICAYNLGYCATGRFENRVVVPFYRDGELVYFQARDMTGRSPIRYDSPSRKEGAIPNVLFNLDRAAASKVVLLVEGPFDALRIPEYAVALTGSGWNAQKQANLLSAKPEVVLLALDNDDAGRHATASITYALRGLVSAVVPVKYDGKDVGELSRQGVARLRALCETVSASFGVSPEKD